MRYPGGGLSAQGRARREKLRLQAAQMFERDIDPVQVARQLRVSAKFGVPVAAALGCGRPGALATRGPGGAMGRLAAGQLGQLRAAVDLGAPRAHPVVVVSGKGSGRVSVAGLVCLKPDARGRLFCRMRVRRGRVGRFAVAVGSVDVICFPGLWHGRRRAPALRFPCIRVVGRCR